MFSEPMLRNGYRLFKVPLSHLSFANYDGGII